LLPSLLHAVLDRVASDPERDALVFDHRRLSYSALAGRAGALALRLSRLGLAPGERVAVLTTPRPEALASMLAAWSLGLTWVGLSPRYRRAEQRHVLANSGARVLLAMTRFGEQDFEPDLASHEAECGVKILRFGQEPESAEESATLDLGGFRAEVPAVIVYTSGTTGLPKGALISHAGIAYRAYTMLGDRFGALSVRTLVDLPLNHIGALCGGVALAFAAGGTLCLRERFDAGATLALVAAERLNLIGMVPSMASALVAHPTFAASDLSSLRYVTWGAGPLQESDLRALLAKTAALFSTQYGMTETNGPICYTPPTREIEPLLAGVGCPDARLALRIAASDGRALARGEEGEVQVRVPHPFLGYLGDAAASVAAFSADGYLRSGDRALLRDDGVLVFRGRSKEMFKSGGFNVYPREVELALEQHPRVKAAAVIAQPDAKWGQVGHAFVELDGAATAQELKQWCDQRLANYKIPKAFTVLAQLPRTGVEKIDRRALALLLDCGDTRG